jgi:NAD(P)-dependent dehydrogenase (short-subunit alcohol dehydrogenase family)
MAGESIRFDGQVALVTGAGRGLGAAYARLLAARGARVLVHDAGVGPDGQGGDRSVADATVEAIARAGGNAAANYALLGDRSSSHALVASAIEQFGRLDILIHNAGLVIFEAIEDVDEAHYRRMMDVHVHAPFWLAQAAMPVMRAQGYGRIVFTTSGRALYTQGAVPGLSTYNIGKMAQVGLTNALAVEGRESGVRVNAISPVAATRILRRSVAPGTHTAGQVAPGVAYLASARCDVSGVILRADDGRFSTVSPLISEEVAFEGAGLTPEAVGDWLEGMLGNPT